MFIFKDTKRRANPHASYVAADGTKHLRIPSELLEWVDEPNPPEGYVPEHYIRTEMDVAPYVHYERRPEEQIIAQMVARYESALDAHLDSVAQADRWKDRFTFVARAGYPNSWRGKATAFGTWMDDCNSRAYTLLEQVLQGQVAPPSVEEFISSLPTFNFVE